MVPGIVMHMLTMAIPDWKFCGLLVHSTMFLIYSPDGTTVYASRDEECEGIWSM